MAIILKKQVPTAEIEDAKKSTRSLALESASCIRELTHQIAEVRYTAACAQSSSSYNETAIKNRVHKDDLEKEIKTHLRLIRNENWRVISGLLQVVFVFSPFAIYLIPESVNAVKLAYFLGIMTVAWIANIAIAMRRVGYF